MRQVVGFVDGFLTLNYLWTTPLGSGFIGRLACLIIRDKALAQPCYEAISAAGQGMAATRARGLVATSNIR